MPSESIKSSESLESISVINYNNPFTLNTTNDIINESNETLIKSSTKEIEEKESKNEIKFEKKTNNFVEFYSNKSIGKFLF